jgi:hypothetical protein
MRDLKKLLMETDEEYLIGLSNKGTVKRARKDMETIKAGVVTVAGEAVVTVGEETVTIRRPLGESECTCPSRSVCRHIIQAVFTLQKELAGGACDKEQEGGAKIQPQDGADSREEEKNPGNEALWEEICAFPFQKAKRTMGNRNFGLFVQQVHADILPEIVETSVLTVRLPGQEHTVKLLSPLEYATCTCHKKDLCAHKAAAILWCRYQKGLLKREELQKEGAKQQEFDPTLIQEAAGAMKGFLEMLLDTGLARVAPDVLQDMERMAIISHNAGLARFEGYFRALSGTCDRYFKRAASFTAAEFADRLTRLYRMVCGVGEAQGTDEIAAYAGSFRASYQLAGDLELTGIALESFESKAGYAGETVYFLEEKKQKWYTYTYARPLFYEGTGRRRNAASVHTPWGLSLSMEEIASARLFLRDAKADERGRLSSSGETKGECAGMRRLTDELLKDWYYEDFYTLFRERIPGYESNGEETEDTEENAGALRDSGRTLVFVRPCIVGQSDFSDVKQSLTLPLQDGAGRELLIEVVYSRRESATIRYLERVARKWSQDRPEEGTKPPCFFGRIYLEDDRIHMYPLAIFEDRELGEITGAHQIHLSDDRAENEGMTVVGEVVDEAIRLMEEICQSGFYTVHDDTLEALGNLVETAAEFGLAGLSDSLRTFVEGISMRRHRIHQEEDDLAKQYGNINRYLYLCREKIRWDKACEYYRGGTEI